MRNAINFCIRLLDGMLLFVGCHLCDALHFEAAQRGRHTGRGPARLSFFLRSLWRRLIGEGKRENYFTFVPLLESKQIINSTRLRERISWLSTMIDFFDVVFDSQKNWRVVLILILIHQWCITNDKQLLHDQARQKETKSELARCEWCNENIPHFNLTFQPLFVVSAHF